MQEDDVGDVSAFVKKHKKAVRDKKKAPTSKSSRSSKK